MNACALCVDTTYLFHRHIWMLNFNDCAKFFDNADFYGVSSLLSPLWLRLKSAHSASESSAQPSDYKIHYDITAPIVSRRYATH